MTCGPVHRSPIARLVVTVAAAATLSGGAAAASEPPALPPPGTCVQHAPSLPAWVHVAPELQRDVDSMLATSATFRVQCRRIAAAPRLLVLVRVDATMIGRSYRARTTIDRTRAGALVARVYLSARTDPVEWLAHEFEHIVEQLDGVDLRALAGRHGVWESAERMYETARAIEAGRAVLAETRGAGGRRRQDNLVE